MLLENSYDHENATRLIDEQSPDKSPSQSRILNVYQTSAERSAKRFSSKKQAISESPANIKIEPVRMGLAAAFEN